MKREYYIQREKNPSEEGKRDSLLWKYLKKVLLMPLMKYQPSFQQCHTYKSLKSISRLVRL